MGKSGRLAGPRAWRRKNPVAHHSLAVDNQTTSEAVAPDQPTATAIAPSRLKHSSSSSSPPPSPSFGAAPGNALDANPSGASPSLLGSWQEIIAYASPQDKPSTPPAEGSGGRDEAAPGSPGRKGPVARGWKVFPDEPCACLAAAKGTGSRRAPAGLDILRVRGVTYNMGGRVPSALSPDFLGLGDPPPSPTRADENASAGIAAQQRVPSSPSILGIPMPWFSKSPKVGQCTTPGGTPTLPAFDSACESSSMGAAVPRGSDDSSEHESCGQHMPLQVEGQGIPPAETLGHGSFASATLRDADTAVRHCDNATECSEAGDEIGLIKAGQRAGHHMDHMDPPGSRGGGEAKRVTAPPAGWQGNEKNAGGICGVFQAVADDTWTPEHDKKAQAGAFGGCLGGCQTGSDGGTLGGDEVAWDAAQRPSELSRDAPPDLLVIGVQEAGSISQWSQLLRGVLEPRYTKVASETLLGLHLRVYMRSGLRHHLTNIHTSSIPVGVGNMLGNKGGVAVAMKAPGGTRLLFVVSHLAAHTQYVAQRNSDYARIRAGLFSSRSPGHKGTEGWQPSGSSFVAVEADSIGEPKGMIRADSEASVETMAGDEEVPPPKPATPLLKRLFCNARDVTRHFDATVWMGDLNYRLEGSRQAIEFAVKQGRFQELHKQDQLLQERQAGRVFQGFEEGPLCFPPTFKFDIGSNIYDTSGKLRTPAWTDRILWRCLSTLPNGGPPILQQVTYDSVRDMRSSDHRPVYSDFLLFLPEPTDPVKKRGKVARRLLGPLHRLRAAFCAVA